MPRTDFVTVERRLRDILEPYRSRLVAIPDLDEAISPALRRRKQGKSCFNFTTVDEPLFAELAELLAAGFDRYLALAAEVATRRS